MSMLLNAEMKDFFRKVLLLGVALSVLINLLVTYFIGLEDKVTYANTNEQKFARSEGGFLGKTGVAVSYNIGMRKKDSLNTPVTLSSEVLPISYILANKTTSRNRIITSNMIGLGEYLNILKSDVNGLLDQSSDRAAMLESFLDQLKYRYTIAHDQINILSEQAKQLKSTVDTSSAKVETLKQQLTQSYKSLDYEKTQATLDEYLLEKDKNVYATTYLVFVNKFIESYTVLNQYNKLLLDTLINNREALVKNVTVVMPDSGTSLMKKFDLIKTEAEFKKNTSN